MDPFAPDPDMCIYVRGIHRRVSPMLGGNHRRIRLAFSLLFTLPGAPLLIYGDEIGMGDDLAQPGRFLTRTLTQWTNERNAGFSTAPADGLVRPVIAGGITAISGSTSRASVATAVPRSIRLTP